MKKKENNTFYRKYRPKKFSEVFGQEEVVSVLKKTIEDNSVVHAYLFSGTRGSGKTSIARIFANELGVSADDIHELDAASNRGINNIRDLINEVSILPLFSKYKVYIIDEAHMLTNDASNALLKTLEEPPEHVIFILATTEKNKFLDTIISRCQVFDFKNASFESVKKLILKIAKKESVKIDEISLQYIATESKGSFRDAVSLFQKILVYTEGDIKIDKFKDKLIGNSENINQFLLALSEKNKDKLLKIYLNLKKNDINLKEFSQIILEKVRAKVLIENSSDFKKYYKSIYSKDQMDFLEKLDNINSLHLKKILNILDAMEDTKNPNGFFEVYLVDLI